MATNMIQLHYSGLGDLVSTTYVIITGSLCSSLIASYLQSECY